MTPSDAIFVAGHTGMVGSAIVRELRRSGHGQQLITRTHGELDLTRQADVFRFFDEVKPAYVFLAAARVGGIQANSTLRAQFSYDNQQIQANVIHGCWLAGVKKLLFLSSSCVYPRTASQPMREGDLWSGPPEPSSEPYATAKLAGMSMYAAYNAQYGTDFIGAIPPNLYGPNDNYDPDNSHFVAALLKKFHDATAEGRSEVTLWGTGTPRREAMHVDDFAAAAVFLMDRYTGSEPINVGSGDDYTIAEFAAMIAEIIGYSGRTTFDSAKPDGVPRKLLDSTRMHQLGWAAKTSLREGLRHAYQDFRERSTRRESMNRKSAKGA